MKQIQVTQQNILQSRYICLAAFKRYTDSFTNFVTTNLRIFSTRMNVVIFIGSTKE